MASSAPIPEAMDVADPEFDLTTLAGYLRKSHASRPFAEDNRLRFFVSVGFNVSYFTTPSRRKLCGHFDLRNVVEIAPVAEDVAPDAIAILIAEGSSTNVEKNMIISFANEPQSKSRWLAAWTSAISAECVHPSLLPYGSEELALDFDDSFSRQRAVSSRRNLLSARARGTQALTPRSTHHERSGSLMVSYDVTVPPGGMPGDVLRMALADGQIVQVVIPAGAQPGSVLDFDLPAAANTPSADAKAVMEAGAAVTPTGASPPPSSMHAAGTLACATPDAFAAIGGAPTAINQKANTSDGPRDQARTRSIRFAPSSTRYSAPPHPPSSVYEQGDASVRSSGGGQDGHDAAVIVLQARVRGMQARSRKHLPLSLPAAASSATAAIEESSHTSSAGALDLLPPPCSPVPAPHPLPLLRYPHPPTALVHLPYLDLTFDLTGPKLVLVPHRRYPHG